MGGWVWKLDEGQKVQTSGYKKNKYCRCNMMTSVTMVYGWFFESR